MSYRFLSLSYLLIPNDHGLIGGAQVSQVTNKGPGAGTGKQGHP